MLVAHSDVSQYIFLLEIDTQLIIQRVSLFSGGPAGGNGGQGGHIWATVDVGLNSLATFRKKLHFRGGPGTSGGGSGKHGACGGDVEVKVPKGTIIRARGAPEGTPPLAELLREGRPVILPSLPISLPSLFTALAIQKVTVWMSKANTSLTFDIVTEAIRRFEALSCRD